MRSAPSLSLRPRPSPPHPAPSACPQVCPGCAGYQFPLPWMSTPWTRSKHGKDFSKEGISWPWRCHPGWSSALISRATRWVVCSRLYLLYGSDHRRELLLAAVIPTNAVHDHQATEDRDRWVVERILSRGDVWKDVFDLQNRATTSTGLSGISKNAAICHPPTPMLAYIDTCSLLPPFCDFVITKGTKKQFISRCGTPEDRVHSLR